ncbi:CRISPR-associated helicase Cas3' [Crassaminicella indica]|uniref:CRISPR-associated helicase Cas3 n=1 Tax=Crassaminicella indica TaxID=2855394 RepID=A0ABX8R8K7_9CLOT|nr:CRISPR-associated helicase Cas3' [Crassaminicella indica]QXM05378.1 CRISPR-associated helicase Cas3' [Crassaminicella indica]
MLKLKDLINDANIYLAHIRDKKDNETLQEHLDLTYTYYKKLYKEKEINKILDRGLKEFYINKKKEKSLLSDEGKRIFLDLFDGAIYYHDLGKINPSFQKLKMKNQAFESIPATEDSTHGLLSALLYIDIFYDDIKSSTLDKYEKNVLLIFMLAFSYAISRHHTYLLNLEEHIDKLKSLLSAIKHAPTKVMNYYKVDRLLTREKIFETAIFKQYASKIEKNILSGDIFYLINKLLYSLIIACDYYATSDYMNKKIEDFGQIEEVGKIYEKLEAGNILKGIRKYAAYKNGLCSVSPFDKDSINNLRSEIFLESEKRLLQNMDENIFYLEAPTGSGKTINSLNLGLALIKNKKLKRLFYVFPFNTLCDQTYEVISEYLEKDNTVIINSLKPIKMIENEELDYDKAYLDRLFLHYPFVLTSHVNFFNYLFSNGRENQIPLVHIANSVVILDEIQSYKVSIWKELANMIDLYARILNIKFIIMSATLPKISMLCKKENLGISLIKDSQKYFSDPKFKDRVKLDYTLLDKGKLSVDALADYIVAYRKNIGEGRILIEFINKTRAREFYNLLREKDINKDTLFELTGDDNALFRKDLLKRLKEQEKGEYVLKDVIVVCTQVIEAGVDIDMDIGFKDISILEAEEQFLGRINRSNTKKNAKVYFFYCDDTKSVYREDYRTQYSLLDKKYRNILAMKNFKDYYAEVLQFIEKKKLQSNDNAYAVHENKLKFLEYKEVCKRLKLIDTVSYSVFIAHELVNPATKERICGKEVWKRFKDLLKDTEMSYSKKQIYLSQIKEEMNYFIYQVYEQPNFTDDDEIEDIYYIEDGEKYFKDGKLDRLLFTKEVISKKGDPFL